MSNLCINLIKAFPKNAFISETKGINVNISTLKYIPDTKDIFKKSFTKIGICIFV